MPALTSSENNAPRDAQNLQNTQISPLNLRYPLDVGTQFNHAVNFVVHKMGTANLTDPLLGGGSRDADAGRSRPTGFPTTTLGFTTAAALRATGDILSSDRRPELVALAGIGGYQTLFGESASFGTRTVRLNQNIMLYTPDTMVVSDEHKFTSISLTEAAGLAGFFSNANSTELAYQLASRTDIIGPRASEAAVAGQGYAINPRLELIFEGSQQRRFLFQFRFTPRSKKEAEEVIKIIKAFRFHSAAEYAPGDKGARYFIPPSQFEIQFKHKVDGKLVENPNLPRTAPCVLNGVTTNYAAGGNYATFNDGVPVEITMDLSFIETIVLTKEDIQNGF